MSIVLSSDLAQFVQSRVASGNYADETEVIREAFKLLECREQLLRHIDEGTRQLRNGEFIEIVGEEALRAFFQDIKARGRQPEAASKTER